MMVRAPPEERPVPDLLSFGVVNLDKPPGPSAHQVAAWVRDATGQDRVAHGGTLDPKVTGCLPILLGDAARAARIFDDAVKEYVAVLELHESAPPDFESVVAQFEGDIYQKPPRKSAVKRQLRTRRIHDLDVLEQADRRALLRVRCASGTYIRKLCHDIGLALGTGAHMGDLRRTATGQFDDRSLVSMHDLVDALAFAEDGDEGELREFVQPAERALDHLPRLVVAPSAAEAIADGAPVYAPGVIDSEASEVGEVTPTEGELVGVFTPNGAAVALGTLVGAPDAESGTVADLERVLV
ncbi:RNA-guided pseudouridylation complex pseudouridine synthase subunit Cbf5 [Haloarcula salinisoli]|uniref:Probable tRNA pseudouridine synthase B n=1 Tax=Haloarcula salinisoli TaxID=2487746 RepID=A0A8J8C9B9_9EURY|nr:RNA-guided pseudouridylation complex pseudouridine synthase subunit Cbf5 [Halomicroarcula salinisoli]MBX0287265.1 RNA-guided pseudouridylation complex pseudouridine synthase subunit Cbf5 [Halomicroarcula salinisoli]MBX0305172.1 RNA-guided pseudouridylation complex pseudouridine synthase subunit Cbf5 [Halomicroarcula salinisoli]